MVALTGDVIEFGQQCAPAAFVGWGDVYGRLAPMIWRQGFNPIPIDVLPDGAKMPLIKWRGFQATRMSEATARRLVHKFGHCAAVAIPTGPGSDLTVVDIDGGASDIDFALETFGEPEVMAETPSFGVHLYYRHTGEPNACRVAGRPIDIRGAGGLIVVPGSVRNREVYRFILGGWEDLSQLCPMKSEAYAANSGGPYRVSASPLRSGAKRSVVVLEGMRDNELYRFARNKFASYVPHLATCASDIETQTAFDDFVRELVLFDCTCCKPPLGEAYVRMKARYWWCEGIEGRLFAEGQQAIVLPVTVAMNELAHEEPAAMGLLFRLKQMFRPLQLFSLPEIRAGEFGMAAATFRRRMKVLVRYGLVELVRQGGRFGPGKSTAGSARAARGDANLYRLPLLR